MRHLYQTVSHARRGGEHQQKRRLHEMATLRRHKSESAFASTYRLLLHQNNDETATNRFLPSGMFAAEMMALCAYPFLGTAQWRWRHLITACWLAAISRTRARCFVVLERDVTRKRNAKSWRRHRMRVWLSKAMVTTRM